MKGDFSWFDHRPADNYTGVLEQQGRVRLDRDGLEAEEIARHLRALIGRDAFGPARVAVPAAESGSLRVGAAQSDGQTVEVTFAAGRAWVDGIPFMLAAETSARATYLPPPFQPETDPSSIAAGVRDAVILEIWEDSVSGFQEPETLLEPALGGVDTTERIKVFWRLRLRRLDDDEDCLTIRPSLQDEPDALGHLTVTPSPAILIAGDCPVEAGGGYTGDGHRLYCIEIAPAGPGGPRFAWSRFGGGLVGRGRFDSVANEIAITHNLPMIAAANVSGFYLQAFAEHPTSGEWTVAFQATVSFTDGVLDVSGASGSWPAAAGETAFFRLWDGIEDIADFNGAPTDLADGIRLEFDPAAADSSNYREGDRWLFPARAAGTPFDPASWPSDAPPLAIRYHRAPLATLTWTAAPPVEIAAPADIEDCRDGFQPLTDGCHCCTVTVGDGRSTHGDVDSIEEAIARLPAAGGRICLLPGIHETNAVIEDRANIRVTGCGRHTRVIPRQRAEPIFHVIDSEGITLDSMDIISISGVAILAESSDEDALRRLVIAENRIIASVRAIQVEGGSQTIIRDNLIRMLDRRGAGVAIYLTGQDGRIEDNDIGVIPADATPQPPDDPDDDGPDDPEDPCADFDLIYANVGFFLGFAEFVFGFNLTALLPPPYRALGGVQIGAGAERVAIIDNRITGGAGNGITLGGSHLAEEPNDANQPGPVTMPLNRSDLALRATVTLDGNAATGQSLRVFGPSGQTRTVVTDANGAFETPLFAEQGAHRIEAVSTSLAVESAVIASRINLGQGSIVIARVGLIRQREEPDPALGFLYDIRIEDNDITAMGLNGIGTPPPDTVLPGSGDPPPVRVIPPRFTAARAAAVNPLLAQLGQPVVDLDIRNNRIVGNLMTPFTGGMRDYARRFGLGGISLGLCETVQITDNRIEENGRRHVDPVCGIFVLFGEQIEIAGNLVRDNGPFVDTTAALETGHRGGVVGIFLSLGLADLGRDQAATGAKPALRLHDNVIQQPMGRALTAIGAGPFSVMANHLSAERTGTATLDVLAGAVLLFSLSGIGRLPSGGCLVNDNQIGLGPASTAFVAVVLAAGEDLGLEANQIDAMQDGIRSGQIAAMLNTLVYAATARALGNRFRERELNVEQALQVSLIATTTRMNCTTTNQGDHCIFASDQSTPPRLVNTANLVLDTTFCERLTAVPGRVAAAPLLGTATLSNTVTTRPAPAADNVAPYTQPLDASLAALNGWQGERLAVAADAKAMSGALHVNEVARFEARPGTRADLLEASRARAAAAVLSADQLRAAREVVTSRPATPPDREMAIQGRVIDANGGGVPFRSVRLGDARGTPLDTVEPAQTDANGGYLLRIGAAPAERLRETLTGGVTIVVAPEREGAATTVSTVLRPVTGGVTIAPDVRIEAGPVRPTRPGGPVTPAPLGRPVLTRAARVDAATGRIAPLVRSSRGNADDKEPPG